MASTPQRIHVSLAATLGFGIALGAAVWAVSGLSAVTGPDAPVWLTVAMIVAAVAGFLAVLLRLSGDNGTIAVLLQPALGAGGGFLLAGGVLHSLGSGDPLRGPAFALAQFAHPGIYLVLVLSVCAAAASRMGTSPHRGDDTRPIG